MKTNTRSNPKDFLIGQDVELYLLHRGKAAPFEGDIKSEFGLDGVTGASRTCEIRTLPSQDPLEIINSIHQVFKRKIKTHPKVLNYDWHGGSFKLYPLGGHIHFECSKKDVNPDLANRIIGNYVGALSLAVEDKAEALERRTWEDANGHVYGHLNDIREKSYGFESRCFSSWVSSPAIAAAHLCLSKVVMNEILNNKSFSPNERFSDDDFVNVRQNKVKQHFDAIWNEITQMSLYPKYKEYIDIFKFLIENDLTWFHKEKDVKIAWGLCDNTIPMQQMTLSSIWASEKPATDIFKTIPEAPTLKIKVEEEFEKLFTDT